MQSIPLWQVFCLVFSAGMVYARLVAVERQLTFLHKQQGRIIAALVESGLHVKPIEED